MIRWQIRFFSLAGYKYYVNIYDPSWSGGVTELYGGAQPVTIDEDESDDMFIAVRKQSGYLSVISGLDVAGNSFDWKQFVALDDKSRPVQVVDDDNQVLWQGFLQAETYEGSLYGLREERNFPLNSMLGVLECDDIVVSHEIHNFAWLLEMIFTTVSPLEIGHFYFQGGLNARQHLLMRVDYQNLISLNDDNEIEPKYTKAELLENICKFWGWTAREYKQDIYFTCADDTSESYWLRLTPAQLHTLATESSAVGDTVPFSTEALSGDIYANTENNDLIKRCANKATVKSDANALGTDLFSFAPDDVHKTMEDLGGRTRDIGDKIVNITTDLHSFDSPFLYGSAGIGLGSFNIMTIKQSMGDPGVSHDIIHIIESYSSTSKAYLKTTFEHVFYGGYIGLFGTIYDKNYNVFESTSHSQAGVGDKNMWLRLGIGHTYASAKWWNGSAWQSAETAFKVTIGNESNLFRNAAAGSGTSGMVKVPDGLSGYLFLHFLGSDDMEEVSGKRSFIIADFQLNFAKTTTTCLRPISTGDNTYRLVHNKVEREHDREYRAKSNANLRKDFSSDNIFATDKDLDYGFAIVIDGDEYMTSALYNSGNAIPEQHLADRVAAYGTRAKRVVSCNLLVDKINGTVTPRHQVTLDGTTFYPVAISNDWRNDILKLLLMEI